MENQDNGIREPEIRINTNVGPFGNQSARNFSPRSEGGNFSGRSEAGSGKKNPTIIGILEKIIGLSIFMLILGLPLFFTGFTFQGIIFEKQLYFYFWLLIGLVSWAAKGVITEEMEIRRTPLDIPIIGFWVIYLFATIFSVDRWHSFWGTFGDPSRGFMSVTGAAVAYYLIMSNFNFKRLRLFFRALVISNVILVIWTSLIFLKIPFIGGSISSFFSGNFAQFIPLSPVGSVTGLAIYLSFMLIIIAVAILKIAENNEISAKNKKIYIAGLSIILALNVVLLMSMYGFIVWTGLFLGLAIFLIYILSKVVKLKMSWVWLPMLIFVLVMMIRMIGEISISRVNLPTEASINYKLSWDIAGKSMKNNFFLGSGPGTFSYDFSLFKPQYYNENSLYELRFFQGTGAFFEAISTVGVLGTILLLLVVLSYLSVGFYLLSREKEKNKLYSLGLFAASFLVIVDIMTVKTEGTIMLIGTILGTLSLASMLFESETQPKVLKLSLKASPKFALALAFVFMVICAGVASLFIFLGKIYTADIYAGKASRTISSDQEKAVIFMGKAAGINKNESAYFSKLGEYYMILANKEALKEEEERDIDSIKRYLNASIEFANLGKKLSESSISATETMAVIYENSGIYIGDSLQLAEAAYQKALELDPNNPNYFVKIGQINIAKATSLKDEEEKRKLLSSAKDNFNKAIEKKGNLAVAHYQLALVLDALGEKDTAIDEMVQAVKFDQRNGDYLINLANMYRFRNKDKDINDAIEIIKYVIQSNDKNANAHFYLGLAYEKAKDKNNAIQEYQKVISLLPENSDDAKKQLEKMIENVNNGVENTPESLGLSVPESNTENQEEPTVIEPQAEQELDLGE